jgi:hypothetical protein
MTCTMPKKTMYMMLDTWHGALSPSAWKQSDLFIALYTQAKSGVNFLRNSGIHKYSPASPSSEKKICREGVPVPISAHNFFFYHFFSLECT